MDSERNMDEKASASVIQVPLETEESGLPGRMLERGDIPGVLIQGDIRLRVPESSAAHRPVRGRYHIETEGLREPLQVIWMLEGKVLTYKQRELDVAFDVRDIPRGETLTQYSL